MTRLENLQNTVYRLLQLGAIPIINENDSVATEEIAVGDNDTMGALVAKYARADLLVVLSDIDGLYTADPHTHPDARRIELVEEITPEIDALAGGTHSGLGTGGMATKLVAAHIATGAGVRHGHRQRLPTLPCSTTLWRASRWAPAFWASTEQAGARPRANKGRFFHDHTRDPAGGAVGPPAALALADTDTKNRALLKPWPTALTAASDDDPGGQRAKIWTRPGARSPRSCWTVWP